MCFFICLHTHKYVWVLLLVERWEAFSHVWVLAANLLNNLFTQVCSMLAYPMCDLNKAVFPQFFEKFICVKRTYHPIPDVSGAENLRIQMKLPSLLNCLNWSFPFLFEGGKISEWNLVVTFMGPHVEVSPLSWKWCDDEWNSVHLSKNSN